MEVPYADIARLDAKRFSVIKTTALVVAGVLVVAGIVIAAAGAAASTAGGTL